MKRIFLPDLRNDPDAFIGARVVHAGRLRGGESVLAHALAALEPGKRGKGECGTSVTHLLGGGEHAELQACIECAQVIERRAAGTTTPEGTTA